MKGVLFIFLESLVIKVAKDTKINSLLLVDNLNRHLYIAYIHISTYIVQFLHNLQMLPPAVHARETQLSGSSAELHLQRKSVDAARIAV